MLSCRSVHTKLVCQDAVKKGCSQQSEVKRTSQRLEKVSGTITTPAKTVGPAYNIPRPLWRPFPSPHLISAAQLAGRMPAGPVVGTDVTDTSYPSAASKPGEATPALASSASDFRLQNHKNSSKTSEILQHFTLQLTRWFGVWNPPKDQDYKNPKPGLMKRFRAFGTGTKRSRFFLTISTQIRRLFVARLAAFE